MRKLVLLVCVAALWLGTTPAEAGIIPSWSDQTGKLGFTPISNEFSLYRNVDDAGVDRGTTLQFVLINSVKVWTEFNFEFTADYNFDYTPGLDNDHYIEIGIVKPVTSFISLNVQRVISTFEPKPINQFGIRLVF